MAKFCKSKGCPSSQQVLAFQLKKIDAETEVKIRRHLAKCDFCASEAEFYAYFPQDTARVKHAEMPKPLFELAEAVLIKKHGDEFFERLTSEVTNT